MIRVYFVFEDPLDEAGVNLSCVDIAMQEPGEALERFEQAAESGELWRALYPEDVEHPYKLIKGKAMYLDVTVLQSQRCADVLL